MQISDIFLAFPGMVFAIAFSGVLQSGMTGAVVSLILVSWPEICTACAEPCAGIETHAVHRGRRALQETEHGR